MPAEQAYRNPHLAKDCKFLNASLDDRTLIIEDRFQNLFLVSNLKMFGIQRVSVTEEWQQTLPGDDHTRTSICVVSETEKIIQWSRSLKRQSERAFKSG